MATEYTDHPLADIERSMRNVRLHGGLAYQKFTCDGCGNRLMIEEPFKLYKQATCDNCSAVTDIQAKGCNFLAVFPSDPVFKEWLEKSFVKRSEY